MADEEVMDRRGFLGKVKDRPLEAAGVAAGLGAIAAIIPSAIEEHDRNEAYLKTVREAEAKFDALSRVELVVKQEVPNGADVGFTMVGETPMPTVTPGGSSVKDVSYIIPREFLALSKSGKLDDPAAVARTFGIAYRESDRNEEPHKIIGCYKEGKYMAHITLSNIGEHAEHLKEAIDKSPTPREVTPKREVTR